MRISAQTVARTTTPPLAAVPAPSAPVADDLAPALPADDVLLSEAANPKIKSFRPEQTEVYKSALRLCAALASLNIPCAIAGGLAVGAHGYQRSTRDVDVIVATENLEKFQKATIGHGWVERFKGSRNLRDTISKVDVDVILTSDKPVTVPDPENSSVINSDGLRVLSLPSLISLKMATASLSPERGKDLKDVSGLIWSNGLEADFARHLEPGLQGKFTDLVQQEKARWA